MLSDSLALVVTHDCPPPSGIAKVTVGSGVGRGATEYPLEPIAIRFDGVDGATVSTMGGLRTTLKKISSVPRRVSVHTITASPGVMAIPVRSPRFAVRPRTVYQCHYFYLRMRRKWSRLRSGPQRGSDSVRRPVQASPLFFSQNRCWFCRSLAVGRS